MSSLTITNTTHGSFPAHPYEAIKNDILGRSYNLSLAFVGGTRAQKLNVAYRQKTYVPNVLSFPLANDCGEVYIAPSVAKKEAHKFSMTTNGYIGFLFIHACLHLKGHDHGATMDKAEKRYCTKYQLR
jgi:rRNA maturation RNase YbeY